MYTGRPIPWIRCPPWLGVLEMLGRSARAARLCRIQTVSDREQTWLR